MEQSDGNEVASTDDSPTRKRKNRSSYREEKIELPIHMRNSFLQDTSHLPAQVFHHLESRITPRSVRFASSPPKKRSPAIQITRADSDTSSSSSDASSSHSSRESSTMSTDNMDLGPDLYAKAEELGAAQEPIHHQHDPQRESSSAAASRAAISKKGHSSSGSSSRYTEDLAKSPDTEADEPVFAPTPFVYKSDPTTAVCRLHEFTYSSQWTRPATELLREILDVRYPVADEGGDESEDEESPLLRAQGQTRHFCWCRMLTGLFSRSW